MAREKGFKVLWDGKDVAPAYPGVIVAARAAWLAEKPDAAARYLCALLRANEWAARPENAAAATEPSSPDDIRRRPPSGSCARSCPA